MAKNFKPEVWSAFIETELEKDLVISKFCDYKYEGEIKVGGRVKVVGIAGATIRKRVAGEPLVKEAIKDNAQFMDIDQEDYFDFTVEDVDKAQATKGFLNKAMKEAEVGLASEADKYVAEVAAKGCLASMKSASTTISDSNAITLLDDALVALYKNNVATATELEADLNPKHAVSVKSKLNTVFTNNVDYLKQGAVGKYGNTLVKMSNNLYNDGTNDHELVRTSTALSFANQINKVETLRDPDDFQDIVRGLHTYGSKVMRPKELYVILAK